MEKYKCSNPKEGCALRKTLVGDVFCLHVFAYFILVKLWRHKYIIIHYDTSSIFVYGRSFENSYH